MTCVLPNFKISGVLHSRMLVHGCDRILQWSQSRGLMEVHGI